MSTANRQYALVKLHSSRVKHEGEFAYRDLNKNGKLDVYEDPRRPVNDRVEDLLSQMTLEEKAGTLFINGAVVNEDGTLDEKAGAPGFGGASTTSAASKSFYSKRYFISRGVTPANCPLASKYRLCCNFCDSPAPC